MGMTRKDYKLIAAAIATTIKANSDLKPEYALARMVDRLCVDLKADNPRFDRVKFVRACGVPTA